MTGDSTTDDSSTDDPHADTPIERAGPAPAEANTAMILVHGRGARARSMVDFGRQIDRDDVTYLAPQARQGTWYPQSFMAPIEVNQPHLDSALAKLERVREAVAADDFPIDRTILLGFSQGACLASEFVARNPDRYGGVIVLSGGLIGPDGTSFDYEGSMDGTPVFLGCGDQDPHIPVERVEASARAFEDLDATVEKRIYEGMGHGVIEDEMDYVRELVNSVAAGE